MTQEISAVPALSLDAATAADEVAKQVAAVVNDAKAEAEAASTPRSRAGDGRPAMEHRRSRERKFPDTVELSHASNEANS
ncbi:hypothetical protein [Streptomyces sp. NPDC051561]|uniref:hypothetical protein n=1 Tax=Streptomyces sp. NPDC051561 TaxID=3365658 RepID=UPI0037BD5252